MAAAGGAAAVLLNSSHNKADTTNLLTYLYYPYGCASGWLSSVRNYAVKQQCPSIVAATNIYL